MRPSLFLFVAVAQVDPTEIFYKLILRISEITRKLLDILPPFLRIPLAIGLALLLLVVIFYTPFSKEKPRIMILAIVFLVGAALSLSEGNYAYAFVLTVISLVLALIYMHFRGQENYTNEFLSWLAKNKDVLRRESSSTMYGPTPVDITTEVTSYECCFSFGLRSTKMSSRPIIKGEPNEDINRFFISSLYIVATLLFGWWGVWGPISTIQTVERNARGGNRNTVRALLEGLV